MAKKKQKVWTDANGDTVEPTPTCWCANCGHMFGDHTPGCDVFTAIEHIDDCPCEEFAPRPKEVSVLPPDWKL